MGIRLSFDFFRKTAAYIYMCIVFIYIYILTENSNFSLVTANRNRKRKFIYLGQKMINGNQHSWASLKSKFTGVKR